MGEVDQLLLVGVAGGVHVLLVEAEHERDCLGRHVVDREGVGVHAVLGWLGLADVVKEGGDQMGLGGVAALDMGDVAGADGGREFVGGFPGREQELVDGLVEVEVPELVVVDREADLDLVVLRQAGRDGGQEAGRGVDLDVVHCWLLEVGVFGAWVSRQGVRTGGS